MQDFVHQQYDSGSPGSKVTLNLNPDEGFSLASGKSIFRRLNLVKAGTTEAVQTSFSVGIPCCDFLRFL